MKLLLAVTPISKDEQVCAFIDLPQTLGVLFLPAYALTIE
jgi:hypothetical protein